MKATIKDRIVAHRSSPDVYDPPSFEQMADRIEELEELLKAAQDDAKEAEAYAEELEAKLARAVEALGNISNIGVAWSHKHEDQIKEAQEIARTTIAELSSVSCANTTGGNDE